MNKRQKKKFQKKREFILSRLALYYALDELSDVILNFFDHFYDPFIRKGGDINE